MRLSAVVGPEKGATKPCWLMDSTGFAFQRNHLPGRGVRLRVNGQPIAVALKSDPSGGTGDGLPPSGDLCRNFVFVHHRKVTL